MSRFSFLRAALHVFLLAALLTPAYSFSEGEDGAAQNPADPNDPTDQTAPASISPDTTIPDATTEAGGPELNVGAIAGLALAGGTLVGGAGALTKKAYDKRKFNQKVKKLLEEDEDTGEPSGAAIEEKSPRPTSDTSNVTSAPEDPKATRVLAPEGEGATPDGVEKQRSPGPEETTKTSATEPQKPLLTKQQPDTVPLESAVKEGTADAKRALPVASEANTAETRPLKNQQNAPHQDKPEKAADTTENTFPDDAKPAAKPSADNTAAPTTALPRAASDAIEEINTEPGKKPPSVSRTAQPDEVSASLARSAAPSDGIKTPLDTAPEPSESTTKEQVGPKQPKTSVDTGVASTKAKLLSADARLAARAELGTALKGVNALGDNENDPDETLPIEELTRRLGEANDAAKEHKNQELAKLTAKRTSIDTEITRLGSAQTEATTQRVELEKALVEQTAAIKKIAAANNPQALRAKQKEQKETILKLEAARKQLETIEKEKGGNIKARTALMEQQLKVAATVHTQQQALEARASLLRRKLEIRTKAQETEQQLLTKQAETEDQLKKAKATLAVIDEKRNPEAFKTKTAEVEELKKTTEKVAQELKDHKATTDTAIQALDAEKPVTKAKKVAQFFSKALPSFKKPTGAETSLAATPKESSQPGFLRKALTGKPKDPAAAVPSAEQGDAASGDSTKSKWNPTSWFTRKKSSPDATDTSSAASPEPATSAESEAPKEPGAFKKAINGLKKLVTKKVKDDKPAPGKPETARALDDIGTNQSPVSFTNPLMQPKVAAQITPKPTPQGARLVDVKPVAPGKGTTRPNSQALNVLAGYASTTARPKGGKSSTGKQQEVVQRAYKRATQGN